MSAEPGAAKPRKRAYPGMLSVTTREMHRGEQPMMNVDLKRPPLISLVNVLQLLLGLVLSGLTIYVLKLTRSPETQADPDRVGTVHGLLIGAAVLGIPALITLVGAWGL